MQIFDVIRQAIEIGEKGWITFDELNALCPANTVDPEDIERIMRALSDAGIRLEED
ncbi:MULTISPECIES: RNA polymerase sigma factor region1.1 domain-containing protein [unclassified Bradyrhizobium]|uniref:RNA polymerase sigma factor region1.1 domain-containing protein n=1 Tax=unclassified Bradyrhizobium TaxID=2631580 RepID=UPI002916D53F|nr:MULTISPECIES: RNA polymerase sigma factor region1.1 domain-containing protein [unclassified Bradyrhizobium]